MTVTEQEIVECVLHLAMNGFVRKVGLGYAINKSTSGAEVYANSVNEVHFAVSRDAGKVHYLGSFFETGVEVPTKEEFLKLLEGCLHDYTRNR